ncbi:MAG: YeeE/YedE thiosulfate transporter family protein [Gammaproteobacteria bacterium]|nr:YeeE/YedE thiosulfate transporter family protein [Gammaproteobacteria bacterium]
MSEANIVGGLLGGTLIGLASVLMLLMIGRITGISGILGGVINWKAIEGRSWRVAFIVGLILGAALYRLFWGPLPLQLQAQGAVLVVAGILVGVGTRVGSGCTSGHGVCGVARGSRRSVTATLTFIGMAMLTVYITRHALA